MISIGELIGRIVILEEDPHPIGKVKDALIDLDDGEVLFVVSNGGFFKKDYKFVLASEVAIGDYIIASEESFEESPPDTPAYSSLVGKTIIERTSGDAVGEVVDVRMDIDSADIEIVGKGDESFIVPVNEIHGVGEYIIVEGVHPIRTR